MSDQPPLAPGVGEKTHQAKSKNDFTPRAQSTLPTAKNKSCLWGCGGVFGCFFIFVAMIVGVLAIGVQTVADQFTGAFNLPAININIGDPADIAIPDDIYIPPVERVRVLSQLTTTQYNYADVTEAQRDMPAWLSSLYGDSIVMVVVGTVEAGIDVSEITEDDIVFDDLTQILTVTLPSPELQSCFLDESQSYVVQRNTAVFADTMDNLEDVVRQRALTYYRDTALEEGILIDAEAEAAASLIDLLSVLVNDETVTINIIFEEPLTEPVLPASCE